MTKRNFKYRYWFSKFLTYHGRDLMSAYKNPSSRKKSTWEKYKNKQCASIITLCCQSFTVAYLEEENGKLMFCVDTYGGSHRFELDSNEIKALRDEGILKEGL